VKVRQFHRFTFRRPPPRLHPVPRLHLAHSPPTFFSAVITRPLTVSPYPTGPRRHQSTSIVPITPVDPPPPTPSICLEDAQLSVPARIGVPSRRILWCGGYQEIGGEAADRLRWRQPAAIGRRRLLTRRSAAAIVEVKPVLHLSAFCLTVVVTRQQTAGAGQLREVDEANRQRQPSAWRTYVHRLASRKKPPPPHTPSPPPAPSPPPLLHLRLPPPPPPALEISHTTEKGPPSSVHSLLVFAAAESTIPALSAAAILGPPAPLIRRCPPRSSLPTQSSIHPCLGSTAHRRTLKHQQLPNAEATTSRVSASLLALRHCAEGLIKMHAPILESHPTIVIVIAVAG
jgi:hypothetical protein